MIICLALPLPALGQSDEGRLVRLIENSLSDGAARQVDLQGFQGALSSQASLESLTVADAGGIWLRIEGAELDWTQSALLRGRLEINALTADRVELLRLPEGDAQGPSPEATPFALPDLPVAIEINEAAIAELVLGADVLGDAVMARASLQASLADGSGSAQLQLERTDAPAQIAFTGRYSNSTGEAEIDLEVSEAAGGLISDRLQIEGRPSLSLALTGSGPLDSFSAEFALASDGVARLSGTAESRAREGGETAYDLQISGDLRPVISGDLETFLGADSVISAQAVRGPDGALLLDPVSIQAAALVLDGQLALDPQNAPERFALTGTLRPIGADTRLALPGGAAEIASADLALAYDRAVSDQVTGQAVMRDLEANGFAAEQTQLTLDGVLSDGSFDGQLVLNAQGLAHRDAGIASALGPVLSLRSGVDWTQDGRAVLSGLLLETSTASLSGDVTATPAQDQLNLTADLALESADLSPFGPLAGREISGAGSARLALQMEALSGAFETEFALSTQNLALPGTLPDGLLAGATDLTGAVRRDETGMILDVFDLDGQQVTLSAQGGLSGTTADLDLQAGLRDARLLSPALPGRIDVSAEVTQTDGGPYEISAQASGPLGMAARVGGTATTEPRLALDITGAAPLVLANPFIAPQTASGRAAFDLALNGAPGLDAVSGRVSLQGARIGLPQQGLALQDLAGGADIARGRAVLGVSGALNSGGALQVSGPVGFADPNLPARLEITLDRARLVDPTLYDALIERLQLTLSGNLAGTPFLSGDIALGPVELRVPETGGGAAGAIPDITHLGEAAAERRTRAFAGLLGRGAGGASGAVGLDIGIVAPGRIFLRGRGLDAELGGALRIGGTTGAIVPSGGFELIRGRLGLLGQRFDLTEGRVTLQGGDPYLALTAETNAGAYAIFITVEGPASAPEVAFRSSPDLPEDEVLAQLFFGRSVSSLSAIQALQLADGVAGLAGGGSGVFTRLREGLGLDDLDISTDEAGNAAVRAGRYLSDNIYTDVTVEDGGTGVSLNIDLTPSVTARGGVTSDGESSIGIFFERDY